MAEPSPQATTSQTIELEIEPPSDKVRDLAEIIKGTPLPRDKVSQIPFNNIVNGHYFKNLNNAKLADDGSLLKPFTSEALNKTYELSNQMFNVQIRNRDAVLAENVRKADEFSDVFLKNYKKHGMDAVAMAFDAIHK